MNKKNQVSPIYSDHLLALQSACDSILTETLFKCYPCSKSFKSPIQLDEHKKSKKHRKNEKAYKLQNPDASKSTLFPNNTNFLDQLSKDSEKLEVIENTYSQMKPVKTSLDSLKVCLFCNKEFTGFKKCLDHMRINHSFFILDVDSLINLKAILTYIAERINIGQVCLFCSK